MSEIFHKTPLSDGRSVWLQRNKIKGVRKPFWSVVVTGAGLLDAPEITDVTSREIGEQLVADTIKADVLEFN